MAKISNWMHVDFFTVDQASALWCEIDPSKLNEFGFQHPSEVEAVKQLLVGAIVNKEIAADSSRNGLQIIGDFSKSLVSRAELEKFARKKKLFPAFLFDTLAPFIGASFKLVTDTASVVPVSKPEPAVNKGGRPVEYDWDSFMLEIICRANTPDGLPDSQAELVRGMLQWFSETTGSEPAESSIKLRTSKIYKYLDDKKGLGKNPVT